MHADEWLNGRTPGNSRRGKVRQPLSRRLIAHAMPPPSWRRCACCQRHIARSLLNFTAGSTFRARSRQTLRRSILFGRRLAEFDRIMQQQAITASHHFDPMGDKAASLVLTWIDLEILLAAAKAEQDFCDTTVALAA